MKILIFAPYYPPHIGGLENYTDELNRYLDDRGIEITVFTPQLPKDAPFSESKFRKTKIIRFPAFEIVANYPLPKFWSPAFWKLFQGLFRKDFDFILAETRFFFTSLMALAYARIKKKKWVNIEHGSAFVRVSRGGVSALAKLYDLTFGRMVLRLSDANISISQAVRKFIGRFDHRNSSVIYRGLDLERIENTFADQKLKDKYRDKLIISFVGRLYKWKGVANSITAIKNLPPEIKEKVIFIVAGYGEDYARLKKMADESIIFLGHTSNERSIGLLKVSDIYIHSAYPGGGLSTSLLEAMYCYCAVIATKNEGADEVIKNKKNGLLIEKSDPDLIQEKIVELYENIEDRQRYARKAQQVIRESFDWNSNAEKYIKYFEEILKK